MGISRTRGGRGARGPFDADAVRIGLHPALRAAQGRMQVGERIFAYVDDVYVICFKILEEEIRAHSDIWLHFGKT